MKTDLVDVNDTRKNLKVEIPSDVVDAQIERVTRGFSRSARLPGFRPGKVPPRVVKHRFKDRILHEVAHNLIPRAVDDALKERGVEAVSTPDITDVNVEEGQALTFTAAFDTVPSFDPGDLSTISLRRPSALVDEQAVDQALERLRERSARYEPVEGRGIVDGDTVTVDLTRDGEVHKDVTVELGSTANPPGFDAQILGMEPEATKAFAITYPADYAVTELAGKEVAYAVTLKAIKRRVVPPLDDELAKDLGDFDSLAALRQRVREDLEHEARHNAEGEVRASLLKQLAARLPFAAPESLVEHEIDRRIEELAQRLIDQNVDPRQTGIDWKALRDGQREPATDAIASALVLDEIARREKLEVTDSDVEAEIARYAERVGRTPAAVRASLEKEGALSRIAAGLRREKSIDFAMARATIAQD